jgi:hypothetical protein
MKKKHPTQARDEAIISAADHFEISLFLGSGAFANATATTIDEAKCEARKLLESHMPCSRRPLIYAVTAQGKAAPLPMRW